MSEHWYTRAGKACHTQPTKKGAKSATRATTITDARKMSLLPSVSAIIKMAAAPGLERWKQSQIIKACYECPPVMDEALEEYERHIFEAADKERDEAANLGTRIHAGIEKYWIDRSEPEPDIHDSVINAVNAVLKLSINPVKNEQVVVSNLFGYAGTTDMIWRSLHDSSVGILDFKSCKTSADEPIVAKPSHAAQIAAYHMAYWEPGSSDIPKDVVGHNVYISTTEPGRVEVVTHDYRTLRQEWEWFQACLVLWRHKNKYDPRSNGSA
jgi:hypothetical protein